MGGAPLVVSRALDFGAGQPGLDHDVLADIVDIADDVVVPEAQDGPAVLFKSGASCLVVDGIFRGGMLRAVDLDDQLLRGTGEIDDVACDRDLPAKGQSHQPMRAEFIPKLQFGIGHLAAHRFGAADSGAVRGCEALVARS